MVVYRLVNSLTCTTLHACHRRQKVVFPGGADEHVKRACSRGVWKMLPQTIFQNLHGPRLNQEASYVYSVILSADALER